MRDTSLNELRQERRMQDTSTADKPKDKPGGVMDSWPYFFM
jgi:hypothetical protein